MGAVEQVPGQACLGERRKELECFSKKHVHPGAPFRFHHCRFWRASFVEISGWNPSSFTRKGKTIMKTYLLALYPPDAGGDMPSRDELGKIMQDVKAIREDMKAAGVWIYSGGLDSPSASTVLRRRGGNVLTTDGPFVESKEHIGGVTIVQAHDLNAALTWATKLVQATGLSIEVRPFLLEK
jgi:hypothetical protein